MLLAGSLLIASLAIASPTRAAMIADGAAPANVSVSNTVSQTVLVDWDAGNAEVPEGYEVVPYLGAVPQTALSVEVPGNVTSTSVGSLTNGQSYTFRVKAVFEDGVLPSDPSDAITVAGAPEMPVVSAARAATSDDVDSFESCDPDCDTSGKIYVSWTAPADNGSAINAYTLTLAGPSTVTETYDDAPLPTEALVDGLVDGSNYTITLTASNAIGDTDSAEFGPVAPCSAITAPTALLAVGGDGEVFLSWSEPATSGCSDLAGFKVYKDGTFVDDTSVDDAEPTVYTVTGLTNGTEYDFTVTAVNEDDEESEASDVASATPEADDDGGGDGGGDIVPEEEGRTFAAGRIGGTDRYATAVRLSETRFTPGVPVVYLASGLGFADALSAGPVADKGSGPILLVQPNAIPASTKSELARLQPVRIVILGGTSAVSTDVQIEAANYTTGSVTRVGGADRYETSALLSADTFGPNVEVAYLATGANFADALAAGPVTGGRAPVLLVKTDSIPAATATELTRLRPDRIVILGGETAITTEVETAAAEYTDGEVTRVGGSDRYETAALLSASHFLPNEVARVYLATGVNYADALAAAPLGWPILLVQRNCIPTVTFDELVRLSAGRIVVLGGADAVSTRVRELIVCDS